ncbi:1-pyrroline-5-carboxylate dehydrogenase [Vibrio sp. FNV 38]|nr:1-pyrroline-5-carboxylate dehydrogenase [Vibrio sp. FNV 38]
MIAPITQFQDSTLAFEHWRLIEAQQRSEHLLTFQSQLAKSEPDLAAIAAMQMEYSRQWVEKTHQLQGPTGETNELYLAPRGVTLLVAQEECRHAQIALTAQLIAALIAGNSVVLCIKDRGFAELIDHAWRDTNVSPYLVQCFSLESYQEFVEFDIRSAGYVGRECGAIEFNRNIAERNGVIIPTVVESDFVSLATTQDPALVLRFCTERTRTINITAVGGNATLLELGNPAH